MMNVGDWIRKWSVLQPKEKALYFEGQPFTYQEVNRRTNQLCHLLLESGVKKEDRVQSSFIIAANISKSFWAFQKSAHSLFL